MTTSPDPRPDEDGPRLPGVPPTPDPIAHPDYIGYVPADGSAPSGHTLAGSEAVELRIPEVEGAVGFDIYYGRPAAPPPLPPTPSVEREPVALAAFRQSVSIWLEDADTWDDWPKVEAAILGVLDDTHVEDEEDVTDWQRGYRAAANNARRAIATALGIQVNGD